MSIWPRWRASSSWMWTKAPPWVRPMGKAAFSGPGELRAGRSSSAAATS